MTYFIKPKSEEDLVDVFSLIPEGEYDFEVIKSLDKPSSKGSPMNTIDLKIYRHDGSIGFVTDYLVFSESKMCLRKIKHFCESVGLEKEYQKGKIRGDFTGLSGKTLLKISKGKAIPEDKLGDKPIGSVYPDRNEVKDYIKSTVSGMKELPNIKNDFNDDLPF